LTETAARLTAQDRFTSAGAAKECICAAGSQGASTCRSSGVNPTVKSLADNTERTKMPGYFIKLREAAMIYKIEL
jgi:hypothetical protein